MATLSKGSLFVVWRAYQGRVDAMRRFFGYEPLFLGQAFRRRLWRPLEYAVKAVQTLTILLRRRPAVVWLQLPPTPLLYVLALVKVLGPDVYVIADCHNGIIAKPWVRTPFLLGILNSAIDLVLVHNSYVHREIVDLGVREDHCLVLETPGELLTAYHSPNWEWGYRRPWVLFPASFDCDEPVRELFEAAAELPDVTFVVTGNPSRARGRHDLSKLPANVVLTGWVDVERYKKLLVETDLVLALTKMEGVAVNAASEAVGGGKGMVLSGTDVLRELFPTGAVYVRTEAAEIAAGVREALRRKEELEAEVRECRRERMSRWHVQATAVQRRLPPEPRVA